MRGQVRLGQLRLLCTWAAVIPAPPPRISELSTRTRPGVGSGAVTGRRGPHRVLGPQSALRASIMFTTAVRSPAGVTDGSGRAAVSVSGGPCCRRAACQSESSPPGLPHTVVEKSLQDSHASRQSLPVWRARAVKRGSRQTLSLRLVAAGAGPGRVGGCFDSNRLDSKSYRGRPRTAAIPAARMSRKAIASLCPSQSSFS